MSNTQQRACDIVGETLRKIIIIDKYPHFWSLALWASVVSASLEFIYIYFGNNSCSPGSHS